MFIGITWPSIDNLYVFECCTHDNMHTRARTHIHIHTRARTYTHTRARTYTHAHTHARTYTHAHARTYIHTHTHAQHYYTHLYTDKTRNRFRLNLSSYRYNRIPLVNRDSA